MQEGPNQENGPGYIRQSGQRDGTYPRRRIGSRAAHPSLSRMPENSRPGTVGPCSDLREGFLKDRLFQGAVRIC